MVCGPLHSADQRCSGSLATRRPTANAASSELKHLLDARVDCAPPSGALLVSYLGRGRGLYGSAHHDSRTFKERWPEVALGGFFGDGEIGPVQGASHLHGWTSVYALFRQRLS